MSLSPSEPPRRKSIEEQKAELHHCRIPAKQQQARQQAQSNDQQGQHSVEQPPRPRPVDQTTPSQSSQQPHRPAAGLPDQNPSTQGLSGEEQHQPQRPARISTAGRIGDKLRAARIAQGIRLAEIGQETKISRTNLVAMEESRYAELPATPFCRGFYRMYARIVNLDPDNAACQFESERARSPERKNSFAIDFGSMNEDVEAMAERPSLLIFTSIGMIIFILLAFFAFLCWFFSWNPASFLSQKLRSFDENDAMHNRDLRPATSMQENKMHQSLHRAIDRAIDEVKEIRDRKKSVA